MRKYKTYSGEIVNLDDVGTYDHIKGKTEAKLMKTLLAAVGAYTLHTYHNPYNDFFEHTSHRIKVAEFLTKLYENLNDSSNRHSLWLKEQIFLFNDLCAGGYTH